MKKNCNSLVLIFILFFGALTQSLAQSSPEKSNRVQLEWDRVPGAKKYEIELIDPNSGFKAKSHSQNHLFSIRIPVGKYQLRGRVADQRSVWGAWSNWTEFEVRPPKIKTLRFSKADRKYKTDLKNLKALVGFVWSPSKEANLYELKIQKGDGSEIVFEEKTEALKQQVSLPPGSYELEIRGCKTQKNQASLCSDSTKESFEILASQWLSPTLSKETLIGSCKKWHSPNLSSLKILVEKRPFLGNEWQKAFEGPTLSEINQQALAQKQKDKPVWPPGEYRWTVWAQKEGYLISAPLSQECLIKPTEEQLSL